MLIDSAHLEEIRVAVVDGDKLDKFDFASPSKVQIKGNIYLGKIVRVEPSLQAAFVDFGGDKHGFLSFSELFKFYFARHQDLFYPFCLPTGFHHTYITINSRFELSEWQELLRVDQDHKETGIFFFQL